MRISELKEWIEFWHVPVTTSRPNGDRVGAEVKLHETWAKVLPLTGTARMYAEKETNTQPYNITTRYNPILENTGNAVIIWKGKRLKIDSHPTNENAANVWLLFRAYEEK